MPFVVGTLDDVLRASVHEQLQDFWPKEPTALIFDGRYFMVGRLNKEGKFIAKGHGMSLAQAVHTMLQEHTIHVDANSGGS